MCIQLQTIKFAVNIKWLISERSTVTGWSPWTPCHMNNGSCQRVRTGIAECVKEEMQTAECDRKECSSSMYM